MKKPQIISSVTTFFVGVTVAVSLLGGSVYAATGQIYLTPATASVQKGNSITLNLLINPGTTVDSAQATVNFDTAKLTFVSASTTTSAFSAQLQQTVSGGTITIARGDLGGGVSANASIIETITFTAAADTGTTDVTLTNANAVDANAHTYTAPSVANARLTLTAPPVTPTPPATCPTGQTGTPPTCVTPTTGTGNTTGSTGGGTTPKTTPKTTPTPTTTTPTPHRRSPFLR